MSFPFTNDDQRKPMGKTIKEKNACSSIRTSWFRRRPHHHITLGVSYPKGDVVMLMLAFSFLLEEDLV